MRFDEADKLQIQRSRTFWMGIPSEQANWKNELLRVSREIPAIRLPLFLPLQFLTSTVIVRMNRQGSRIYLFHHFISTQNILFGIMILAFNNFISFRIRFVALYCINKQCLYIWSLISITLMDGFRIIYRKDVEFIFNVTPLVQKAELFLYNC